MGTGSTGYSERGVTLVLFSGPFGRLRSKGASACLVDPILCLTIRLRPIILSCRCGVAKRFPITLSRLTVIVTTLKW